MNNILKKICEDKKLEIEILKKKCSLNSLKKLISDQINKRDFKNVIIKSSLERENFIIGEIKKASPSAGEIIPNYEPVEIAKIYQNTGIKALSVLTEKNYFKGEIDHLSYIKQNTNIPILRKDFIIDEYQIYESKVYQADAILLIVSVLSDDELKKFLKIANELNLDCIIETHDENEIKRALKLDYPILGINNRNLKNLKTDLNNSVSLFTSISKDYTVIAESGIKTSDDISMYNDLGIFNFLIGESILRSKDYATFIKKLLNYG
ncbi:indole-3-glycerol phosphate synthase TrpC [Alphaproteobacteria bacterium]|jgi:indole-3-glycerol phosphate synthase|nr:indole-3-glycerol phosphate synthase TrpC [Alphaproteobacteria bacterium]